jgi:hypothetical protein
MKARHEGLSHLTKDNHQRRDLDCKSDSARTQNRSPNTYCIPTIPLVCMRIEDDEIPRVQLLSILSLCRPLHEDTHTVSATTRRHKQTCFIRRRRHSRCPAIRETGARVGVLTECGGIAGDRGVSTDGLINKYHLWPCVPLSNPSWRGEG